MEGLNGNPQFRVQMGGHPDDAELHSSMNEVENVRDTHVWSDLMTLVEERIEVLQHALESADSIEEVKALQGEIAAWRVFEKLPDLLKQSIQTQNQQRN